MHRNWTPELTYVLRVLGAFMLALGGIGVMAARDPLSHPGIVIMFAALLTIRVLQRAVFSNDIQNLFAISSWRLWSTALIFLVLALALVGLLVVCRMDRLGGEAQKGPG